LLSKEEVDRLFEKQAKSEQANREFSEKNTEDWYRQEWIRKKRGHEFPNDALAKQKRWEEDRRSEAAGARLEAREIQKHLDNKFHREHLEVLKQGVLEGAIQIHEIDTGFMIDTPMEKVKGFVQSHPRFQKLHPASDELKEGKFLLGTITDWEKERVNFVRKSLIEEFHAETPCLLLATMSRRCDNCGGPMISHGVALRCDWCHQVYRILDGQVLPSTEDSPTHRLSMRDFYALQEKR
jgi:hypothetical protein